MTNAEYEKFQKRYLEAFALVTRLQSIDTLYAAKGQPLPAEVRRQAYFAQDALGELQSEIYAAARTSLPARNDAHNAMVARFISEQTRLLIAGKSTDELDALAEAELEPRAQSLRREIAALDRQN